MTLLLTFSDVFLFSIHLSCIGEEGEIIDGDISKPRQIKPKLYRYHSRQDVCVLFYDLVQVTFYRHTGAAAKNKVSLLNHAGDLGGTDYNRILSPLKCNSCY